MTEVNQDGAPDERRTLAAAAEGDEKAFRTLVDDYWGRVYFNTLTLVKSPAVAQDLTQDIFLKIWLQRERLAEVVSFKNYIYVVGRHQVIAALRKKIIETADADLAMLREDMQAPDAQLEGKDAYRLLMEGVERLTPQQKIIFKMSRLEGLSHEQIARKLGLSQNTVKVHMVLALNFLRGWLRDLGYLSLFILLHY
ncbi:MAG TPA: RNA polymerase sigma-70 factor [Puia sp.]|jgi:RNA polymerase sigma-70 factor (ECF subfamily)